MWILYAILSSFFGSLMVVFMKIGLKDIDSNVGLFIRTIFVLLLLLGLLLINGKIKDITSFHAKTWVYLVISSVVTFLTWLFYFLALKNGSSKVVMAIDKCSIVFIVIILSVIGQIGDLFFSAVKRNHDIKDYGHLIPGHGGIMDRFDSMIVTAPMIYFLCVLMIF